MTSNPVFLVVIGGLLVNNFVLSQFLGICPFLGLSKKLGSAAGMSLAVLFVMLLATAATHPVYYYLLLPYDLAYLRTIVFILIIAALVQLVEMVLRKFVPPLYKALGIYLPLITTNCAVLGVTINNIDDGYTYGKAVWNAVCVGIGFTLALVIFSGVRSRINAADVPETFKGIPATLVAAAIVSMSFQAFSGMF